MEYRWVLDVPQNEDERLQEGEMEIIIDPVMRNYTERLIVDYVETAHGGQFIYSEREGDS